VASWWIQTGDRLGPSLSERASVSFSFTWRSCWNMDEQFLQDILHSRFLSRASSAAHNAFGSFSFEQDTAINFVEMCNSRHSGSSDSEWTAPHQNPGIRDFHWPTSFLDRGFPDFIAHWLGVRTDSRTISTGLRLPRRILRSGWRQVPQSARALSKVTVSGTPSEAGH
jgi:hypothetical protein